MIERFLNIPNESMLLCYKNSSLTPSSDSVVYITTQSDVCMLAAERCPLAWLWDFQRASVGARVASVLFATAAVNLISPSSHL